MIDKSGWKSFCFEDIVINVKDKAKPNVCDEIPYIGLEHLQSESFEIPWYGTSNDVTGEKILMQQGDVLFGKRRAYQRKVGITPFDGIFSAHGMVLRPKTDVILKELLPFFIRSNTFMNRAINLSVGSLSPTLNWTDIKNEKFILPSIEEQERIAELLWAAYNVTSTYKSQTMKLFEYIRSYEKEVFLLHEVSKLFPEIPKGWQIGYLSDLAEVDPKLPKNLTLSNASFISMDMISDNGDIVEKKIDYVARLKKGYTFFENNDVIFAKITPCMENGKGFIATDLENGMGFGSTEFFVLRPNDLSDRDFIYALTKSTVYRYHAERWMQGSAGQRRVPKDFFTRKRIVLPPPSEREKIGKHFHMIRHNITTLQSSINDSNKVLQDMINLYLGGGN